MNTNAVVIVLAFIVIGVALFIRFLRDYPLLTLETYTDDGK